MVICIQLIGIIATIKHKVVVFLLIGNASMTYHSATSYRS